jgi:colanic acid biosynthesis glycosyl transferase WcaI
VLFLNQYFPPDSSATAELARTLVEALDKAGYAVRVIAGRPSYELKTGHGLLQWPREDHRSATVERVFSTTYPRVRMRGRVMNYLTYIVFAALRSLRTKAEVVVTMTDPPIVGMLGAMIAVFRRIPFAYNIQDLHPDMALASGMIRKSCLTKIWSRLHLLAMRRANLIMTPGFDMRARITAKGISPKKIMVVRHGAEPMPDLPGKDDPLVKELRHGFRFTLMHAGNLGLYGAWSAIIEAAGGLNKKGVGMIFIGTGAAENSVRNLASHCSNVRFLPYRPMEQIPHVMAAGDLQVLTMQRGFEGLVVPSKLYTILSAGRPVLVVADEKCDAARLVAECGCGVVVPPDDPDGIRDAVNCLMSDQGLLEKMGVRALELSHRLSRERYLRVFVEAVRSLPQKR